MQKSITIIEEGCSDFEVAKKKGQVWDHFEHVTYWDKLILGIYRRF